MAGSEDPHRRIITSQTLKPWVIFAGCVLVVVVLYWAQAVLVPIALAVLLTFVLTPPVGWLERWLGRVPAVLAAVTLVFIVLGLAGWGLARQMQHLADDLPTYRVNILAKIADVRGAGKGGAVEEETAIIEATRELLSDAAESIRRLEPPPPDDPALAGPREPLRVLGVAANGIADELALQMLDHLLDDLPVVVEVTKGRMLASELISLVQAQGVSIICLADLPPSPPSKTRYLVKRLHAALPEGRILVGRWGPPALADDSTQLLREAGASLVASTLAETRTYLSGLVEIPRVPVPVAGSVQAA